MAKVTGIGGVFFKSTADAKALAQWYQKHLGISLEAWGGAQLSWAEDQARDGGITVWHVAEKDSEWFSPSPGPFMFNYRIDDMNGMVEQLTAAGIKIIQGPENHENGRFAWILDPEGNKVELWEPMPWDDANKDAPLE